MRIGPFKLPSLFSSAGGGENRRRTSRRPSVGVCNLGLILDLSATGARIECLRYTKHAVGSRVALTVDTDDGTAVSIPCVVCWTDVRNGRREAGLEFTATRAADLARLAHMVTVKPAKQSTAQPLMSDHDQEAA